MCSHLTWRRRHLSTKRIPAELRPIALLGAGGCVRKPRGMGEAWWGRAHTLEIPTRSRRVLYCDRANATDRLKSGALGQAGPGRGASASLPSPASELGVRWVSRALERALSPGPCLCCGTRGRGWCPLPQRRTPGPRALQGHLDGARLLPGQLGWGPGGSFWLRVPSTDLTGRRCSPAHLVR